MHDLPEIAEPMLLGHIPPLAIVSASMIVLIAIMVWRRVPAIVTGALDNQIAAIKAQFAEASALRAEAEQLRADYAARIATAEKDAADLIAHARHEADHILARAQSDATDMIARREKQGREKIAAAERAAIEELRREAINAATSAAASVIAARYSADADRALIDGTIASLTH